MSNQPPSINLVVQHGPNPGQVFAVQKHVQTIGRSSSNDITLVEPSLSRRHARISMQPDGFVVEDLGSSNGTFVNGQRITGPTWLRPGDTLRLGRAVTFSVQPGQLDLDNTYISDASPGEADYTLVAAVPSAPVPAPGYAPPPARGTSPWIWVGVIGVAVLIAGAIIGGLYYLKVSSAPQTQTPAEMVQRATAVQAQQIRVEPTSTPTPVPTATPLPTPEPVEITVPGVSAVVGEEGEPPENIRQIAAGCGRRIEVRADEPVVVNWSWIVAEDSETDYLTQWLEAAYYDVRLDGVPITGLALLNYYHTLSCGDNGECGPTLNWWVEAGLLSPGAHHVTIESYTTRAVSAGFDVNPADGELDVYGPGLVDTGFCDVIVVEVATPTFPPTSTPTPTSAPTSGPTPTKVLAFPLGVFQDFENESAWKRGDQPYGELNRSTAQVHSGSYAGQLTYDFPAVDNEFVVFMQTRRLAGRPNAISAWVYGDNSGYYLNVWIKDAAGEVWQAPLGQIEHTGWQRMTAWLDPGREWPHAHISGPSNHALDYPISFYALVLDDIPDTSSGRGTIYVDDLASEEGAPPLPTSTPTPTSPPPQPQPQPQPGGYTIEISASPNIINVGSCATLSWHIENVQSAHINGEGITGPYGSKQVCPNSTTTYVLTADLYGGGSDTRSASVTVTGSGPGSQYDLYVRRMDFIDPVVNTNIKLVVMIATETYPSGGPYFPATNFHWRQQGGNWQTVFCEASTHQASCAKTVYLQPYSVPGTYNVEVRVDPVANEANTSNNSKVWPLEVK